MTFAVVRRRRVCKVLIDSFDVILCLGVPCVLRHLDLYVHLTAYAVMRPPEPGHFGEEAFLSTYKLCNG